MAVQNRTGVKAQIADLRPFPGNAKTHNLPAIKASLKKNRQFRPVVVAASEDPAWDNVILAGNGTAQAMTELGHTTILVTYYEGTEAEFRRVNLADNRISELGGYEDEALLALLQAVADGSDLDGTGYDTAFLNELAASLNTPTALTDKDDAPDFPVGPTKCSPGQVWALGPHRLAVGDGTDAAVVKAALNGMQADLLLTDPPYGVSYVGGGGKTIQNDELRDIALQRFLEAAFTAAAGSLHPGSTFYVFGPSNDQQLPFRLALQTAKLRIRQELVWVKNALVLGRSDYQPQHESVLAGTNGDQVPDPEGDHDVAFYGWRDGSAHLWRGGRQLTTVWSFDKPSRSVEHPTMKPVAMLEQAIESSTRAGALVLDPFSGSGSTLIACHGTDRVCAAVELDTGYADVILRRYEEHTGVAPQLLGDGL